MVIAPGVSSQPSFAGRASDCLGQDGSGQERSRGQKWYCENEVQIGIFVDDRTLWLESSKEHVGEAVQKSKEFVKRGEKADKVLGWQSHFHKREWAASVRCGHLQLLGWDIIPGQVKAESRVVGVTYNFITHRLDRIRRFAASQAVKFRTVRELVISRSRGRKRGNGHLRACSEHCR